MVNEDYATMEGIAEEDEEVGESIDAPEEEQLRIEGTYSGLSAVVAAVAPIASEAKMSGTSLAIDGEFRVGDRIRLSVDVIVTEVAVVGKRDAEGRIASTTRRHKMVADGVARTDVLS